jgi:hypothetical protein
VQHASEAITAAKVRVDELAVSAKRFAQSGDLNLQILFRHYDARPHLVEQFVFRDQHSVSFQQSHQEVEGARAELNRNTVGE